MKPIFSESHGQYPVPSDPRPRLSDPKSCGKLSYTQPVVLLIYVMLYLNLGTCGHWNSPPYLHTIIQYYLKIFSLFPTRLNTFHNQCEHVLALFDRHKFNRESKVERFYKNTGCMLSLCFIRNASFSPREMYFCIR